MRLLGAIALFAAANGASAADREIHLYAMPEQTLTYDSGVAWVQGSGHLPIALSVRSEGRSRAWLGLVVANPTNEDINVSLESIRLLSPNAGDLRVLDPEQLMKEERRKNLWRELGAAYVVTMNSQAASNAGTYTESGDVNIAGRRGSYTATGVDPIARQQAIERAQLANNAYAERIKQQSATRTSDLHSRLFWSQTISPGASHGGDIAIELPRRSRTPTEIAVVVDIAGYQEEFTLFVDGRPPPQQPQSRQRQLRSTPPANSDDTSSNHVVAMSSRLAGPIFLSPTIEGISFQSRRLSDGSSTAFILFDVSWRVSGTTTSDMIAGKLIVSIAGGNRRVVMPWPISASDARKATFEETGVGFSASELGDAATWLRNADISTLHAQYVVEK